MSAAGGITVWILGDQLLLNHPALDAAVQATDGAPVRVLLIESAARTARLPYQRKKLVLLFSAIRHYAAALRDRGYDVDYVQADSAAAGLRRHAAERRPQALFTMAAAEYAGRRFQEQRLGALLDVPVTVVANTQLLLGRHDPMKAERRSADKPPIMETFYRAMRRHFGVLMQADGSPVGGKWNYDHDNRKPLPKAGLTPKPRVTFDPDVMTREVMAEIAAHEPAFGSVDGFDLAVTHEDAAAAADDFFAQRLADFGPYEDAMSADDGLLYHSQLAPYLNIGLLDPLDLIRRAEAAYQEDLVPLNSAEGFIRQILGWREYIYMHYWLQMPGMDAVNHWGHDRPLPSFFWDAKTEMNCLRCVIGRVIEGGYSHHIERLMVLCNFAMLAGIEPAQVNRWFLTSYIDAYDWVVTPNVMGMGLNADGGLTATKPYIASANYINKMGDFCQGCAYDPKARTGETACPFNFLYWHFLIRNEDALRANPRLGPAVLGLRHLDAAQRVAVTEQAEAFCERLTG